jgi:lipoyl(octanoyl) transferase
MGRKGTTEHLLWDEAERERRAVDLVWSDRGGDATYHGPGQLVGYPILDLPRLGSDILRHIRGLEQSLIACLAGLGMASEPGGRGMTGVWSRGAAAESRPLEKVAAIGVKLNQRVTNHGFALNLTSDLSIFNEGIVPCGLAGKRATSLLALGGPELATADAARAYTPHFGGAFDVDVEWGEASELWALPPAPAPEPRNLLALVPRA